MRKKTLACSRHRAVLLALPSLPADMRSSVVSAHPGAHPAAVLPTYEYDTATRHAAAKFERPLMVELALCRELRAPQPFDLRQEHTDSVPTGDILVHHLQVVDSKRLKSTTNSVDRTAVTMLCCGLGTPQLACIHERATGGKPPVAFNSGEGVFPTRELTSQTGEGCPP